MKYSYSLHQEIDLFVKGRITKTDAKRQLRTAKAILKRFEHLPGIILADEVGMGKTFVALSVAVSVALENEKKQPVVVMVPGSLQKKWPRDFSLFCEKCFSGSQILKYGVATRAAKFLKYLDDPPERRKHIIFLTHGAMSRGLSDSWVKLALIQRALYRRHNTIELKRALYKYLGKLLYMGWAEKRNPEIWEVLLNRHPEKWLKQLQQRGIDPENDNNPETDDDPVPEAVINILNSSKFDELYQALNKIPKRQSKYFEENLRIARRTINSILREIWEKCLKSLELSIPLLILDEAHHLKNSHTALANLFHTNEAKSDADEVSKGPLAGTFERMLFLTATPFQLGHHELCSVLDRFKGIEWDGLHAPPGGVESYTNLLDILKVKLDESQRSALRLEEAWSKLTVEDLSASNHSIRQVDEWWEAILNSDYRSNHKINEIVLRYEQTKNSFKYAVRKLKKLVIRHDKPKELNGKYKGIQRRRILDGNGIIDENEIVKSGINIEGEAIVPFLLAARASVKQLDKRPLFAEGLASSYEAFLKTRIDNIRKQLDTDQEIEDDIFEVEEWHYQQLGKSLNYLLAGSGKVVHPKMRATVNKTLDLWSEGEKVLIFCHFIATGKALRQYISEALLDKIIKIGRAKLKCRSEEVLDKLENLGQRFAKEDSSFRKSFEEEICKILLDFKLLEPYKEKILKVILRYLRTPTFLVRYFSLTESRYSSATIKKALNKMDKSGFTLRQLIKNFFGFLDQNCSDVERAEYINALMSIQTGSIAGDDVFKSYSEDEIQGDMKEKLLPNVRLVNGTTKQETRQKLMLTFNTPFYPDILVASSVMAEGVDLHLNCRYIIHHDLCWNPSTLEQRTGRVDRIGAKVEKCGSPINIYLPYISETQDEKMYKVVMDREKWFKIVMGEKFKVDVKNTDKIAERIPLPSKIVDELGFKLRV